MNKQHMIEEERNNIVIQYKNFIDREYFECDMLSKFASEEKEDIYHKTKHELAEHYFHTVEQFKLMLIGELCNTGLKRDEALNLLNKVSLSFARFPGHTPKTFMKYDLEKLSKKFNKMTNNVLIFAEDHPEFGWMASEIIVNDKVLINDLKQDPPCALLIDFAESILAHLKHKNIKTDECLFSTIVKNNDDVGVLQTMLQDPAEFEKYHKLFHNE